MTQFVQLYESNEEAVKSEIGTFWKRFPTACVREYGERAGLWAWFSLGRSKPTTIDVDKIQARLDSGFARMASLRIGIYSARDLMATYAGNAKDLSPGLGRVDQSRSEHEASVSGGHVAEQVQADPIYQRCRTRNTPRALQGSQKLPTLFAGYSFPQLRDSNGHEFGRQQSMVARRRVIVAARRSFAPRHIDRMGSPLHGPVTRPYGSSAVCGVDDEAELSSLFPADRTGLDSLYAHDPVLVTDRARDLQTGKIARRGGARFRGCV